MSKTTTKEWLTINESASLLRVSTKSIRRWIEAGHLKGYRVGMRAIRIRREDLLQMMTPVEETP